MYFPSNSIPQLLSSSPSNISEQLLIIFSISEIDCNKVSKQRNTAGSYPNSNHLTKPSELHKHVVNRKLFYFEDPISMNVLLPSELMKLVRYLPLPVSSLCMNLMSPSFFLKERYTRVALQDFSRSYGIEIYNIVKYPLSPVSSDSSRKLRFAVDQSECANFRISIVDCSIRGCSKWCFGATDSVMMTDRTYHQPELN